MNKIKTLIDEGTINNRINELAKEINEDYKDKKPVIICILKGAVYFFTDLTKKLNIDCDLEFMKISSYVGEKSTGKIEIKYDRSVVYIASGDLSHKLQEYGPYGFVEEGPLYDKRIMDVMSNARFSELLDFDIDFLDKAAECGHRSFIMMSGFLDNISVIPKFYSHEDITGVGYGICSYFPTDPYIELAKNTINTYIKEKKVIELPKDTPKELLENRTGVFVSIHKKGYLRGCIGTILPVTKCVGEEIINNAISAATHDPRFNPVTEDELNDLEINVDVLTAPEDIPNSEMLDPKKYGVIVSSGYKRGVLLPDLEGVDTIEEQISIAKEKADINDNEEIKLQRFEVIRHK